MNKEEVVKQFYLAVISKTTEYCYERVMGHENCYDYAIAAENIIVDDEKVTAICYKGLLWTLDEVGVQKTVQESNSPNGMYSVYSRKYVTLRRHDMDKNDN